MTVGNITANVTNEVKTNYICLGLQHVEFIMTASAKLTAYFSIFHSLGITATALIGNVIILYTVRSFTDIRNSKNLLFAAMSVTDFLVSIFVLPLNIVIRTLELSDIHICAVKRTQSFASYLLCGWSLVNVAFISIDRYIATAYPIQYRIPSNKRTFIKALAFVWLVWIIILIPPFSGAVSLSVLNLLSAALILSWLFIVVGCYFKIIWILRFTRKRRQIHQASNRPVVTARQHSTKSGAKTIFTITAVFIICYAPWFISSVVLIVIKASAESKYIVGRVVELFLYMNSSLNPFLYCYRNLRLRSAITTTIGKICRKKVNDASS
ncbi:5-hydroxytryptamine receptor 1A-like [Rhopilema esculentum]|uniref:5-hydroxytryptamine receptor 1A-like n=1 Tax=Rhopilema esculentum TaxID=499914 RepID=UPI0031CE5283|eukprot:gene6674-12230_t